MTQPLRSSIGDVLMDHGVAGPQTTACSKPTTGVAGSITKVLTFHAERWPGGVANKRTLLDFFLGAGVVNIIRNLQAIREEYTRLLYLLVKETRKASTGEKERETPPHIMLHRL
jgi:hypothetical protein